MRARQFTRRKHFCLSSDVNVQCERHVLILFQPTPHPPEASALINVEVN